MSQPSILASAPTPETQRRGFPSLTCVLCGEADCVRLDLSDLDTFTCTSCEADFTLDEVREHLAAWGRVVVWIESAPAVEG